MSEKKHEILFNAIPDLISWKEALAWIRKGQRLVEQLTHHEISEAEIHALDWNDIKQSHETPFGLYISENWRKFVLATFLADLVSYTKPVDQVNFERLAFVMHNFPQGFRTWWIKLADHNWWPVGYSGWYPMLETAYELFEKSPEKLKDRMVIPHPDEHTHQPYLYLFNFSVAPNAKKSNLSKQLMQKYVQDIRHQNALGLACITVSDDGGRIAHRFGMSCSGHLNLDGSEEGVYVTTHPNRKTARLSTG